MESVVIPGLRPITVSFCTQRTDGKSAAGRPGGQVSGAWSRRPVSTLMTSKTSFWAVRFPKANRVSTWPAGCVAGRSANHSAGTTSIGSVVHQCNPFTMRPGDPDGCREVFICAGVESMSRVAMGGFNPCPTRSCRNDTGRYMSMGETAEKSGRNTASPGKSRKSSPC
ncbi:MAG: hypothetical protein CM1200mP20_14590 [Pseudomonadota bacterium]|nr:MAG: hypothetical protein CM1200mP20_14590 [Pseudomonadota bacterium]